MRALIDPRQNRVCQLADADFPVADPLFWVDCTGSEIPDSTTYVNGAFVAPPVPPAPPAPQPPQAAVDVINAMVAAGQMTQEIAATVIAALPKS